MGIASQDSFTSSSMPGYIIDALIFDGDPTRIYRARRKSDGLKVMLKSLADERIAREACACLKHEFEMTRRLLVPYVIRVYGLERHNNMPVLVLEDFGGDSLDNLAKQRRFTLVDLLKIGIELAKGLGEIHAQNIIHKDINPSNILYNAETGVVKIIDFGISTILTREQAAIASPKMVQASLPYISPEQTGRMNRAIDYRTDFYSLGVTLYELLTGGPLFAINEPIEWFHNHIAKRPVVPMDANSLVPEAVSDIVMKLLAKMAEDRYQSAHGLQTDLQHCLDEWEKLGSIEPFELGAKDIPHRFQIPQRLYGRDEEITQLMWAFHRASQGDNELILVSGYSGIGKSCLIRELYKPITERRGYFVSGKFDQLHHNMPYSAISGALRDLVRQLLTETENELAKWQEKIVSALGPNAQLIIDVIHELELIIGKQPPVPTLGPVEAEQRFQHVFHKFNQIFAKAEHPLVIFLDDLQWADSASLKAIELLVGSGQGIQHLLVIGAYRTNEVNEGHSLQRMLEEVKKNGSQVEDIELRPLTHAHLVELLIDSTGNDPNAVNLLADLIQQKTAGNPFFTEEFLKYLHKERLINFSQEQGCWCWDIELIRDQKMTDNVVELMTEKLQEFEPSVQELLELGACIGNRFPLRVLAMVSEREPAAIAHYLEKATKEGVIAPIGDAYQLLELEYGNDEYDLTVEFAFAHDRIQQAAYALMNEGERNQAHLKIGRLLLKELPEYQQDERIFEVINHLNLGVDLVDESERNQISHFNHAAGKRAMASIAFHAAYLYFSKAVELLDQRNWQTEYEFAHDLYCKTAEAAYLSTDYEYMETLIQVGLKHSQDLFDQSKFHQVDMSSLIARGKLREAIKIAKPLLSKLGHVYPAKPTKLHIAMALIKVMWRLRKKSAQDLRDLPLMSDPLSLAAIDVGSCIGSAVMFVEPNLLSLMILHSVQVSLDKGLSPMVPMTYAPFGMVLAVNLNQPQRGKEFALMAIDLIERLNAIPIYGRTLHCYNALVRHWVEPVRNTLEPLREAENLCLENGDFEYAGLAPTIRLINYFDSGMDLYAWEQELKTSYGEVKALNQDVSLQYVVICQQLSDNLMGKAENPAKLKGWFYDVDEQKEHNDETGDRSIFSVLCENQLMLGYWFGEYDEALELADAIKNNPLSIQGFYKTIRTTMFDSLTRLACMETAGEFERWKLMRVVKKNQKQMQGWAKNCPENALNKLRLVEAEILRNKGMDFKANELYDEAIALAHREGFLHEEALANELCGKMHVKSGRATVANAYLRNAKDIYQDWGAKAKVDDLQQKYPKLLLYSRGGHNSDSTAAIANFDIASLMKALKSIADEKNHSSMLKAIVVTALEFAGAQRGVLLLRNLSGTLMVEGEASIDGRTPRALQSIPVEKCALAQTVVNYVSRIQSSFVVHDAQQPFEAIPGLNMDDYIQSKGIRSILCLPILSGLSGEHELIGMMYLENTLASGTFTQERFDTLEIICMAAAGRIELSRKAAVDGLTELFNYDYFQNTLTQDFASACRHDQELSLMLIDIDHFKQFNDNWGHQLGDKVLKEVAQTIKNTSRAGDLVARYGGEEMVVVMPSTGLVEAEALSQRIRKTIEAHRVEHNGESLSVTISIGVAALHSGIQSKENLIQRADTALYRSKADGRNRVTVD